MYSNCILGTNKNRTELEEDSCAMPIRNEGNDTTTNHEINFGDNGDNKTKSTEQNQTELNPRISQHRLGSNAGGGGGDTYFDQNVVQCKVNDLVADLYVNGAEVAGSPPSPSPLSTSKSIAANQTTIPSTTSMQPTNSGFGDYTNIRATAYYNQHQTKSQSEVNRRQDIPSDSSISSNPNISVAASTTTTSSNSSFSFKHFLNSSSNTLTAPSTTVTSLDPISSTSSFTPTTEVCATSLNTTNTFQSSTGARPKVPQSASVSNTSISSLLSNMSISGAFDSTSMSSATKMKRSPRFSSFDSQASLAEYVGVDSETSLETSIGAGENSAPVFRLYLDGNNAESGDIFVPYTHTGTNTLTTNSGDYERQYISRSYSNYELPPASPRRRYNNNVKDARRGRHSMSSTSSKVKLDLPLENATSSSSSVSASGSGSAVCIGPLSASGCASATASVSASGSGPVSMSSRPLQMNAPDFPPAPAAAALPDFVQDHWMDSWYSHDMHHVNSARNSPLCDFMEDPVVTMANNTMGTAGPAHSGGGSNHNNDHPIGMGMGLGMDIGMANTAETGNSSKMLPDFLSDGPIIHSSGRLADVAAGLPSNSMGSPQEQPMALQISRLRLENKQLKCELAETRAALDQQTRRYNNLEQQIKEQKHDDSVYNRTMSQNMQLAEENLDKSKKKTAAAQQHIAKLKQQVMQLTAEVDSLRHWNELLREEGAVGGASGPSDRSPTLGAHAVCSCGGSGSGGAGGASGASGGLKSSKAQKISRELIRAASNAESNLRQLLTGVENLRQLAADIENSDSHVELDVSPDAFSDFLDECDDYEDYSGGPAL